MLVRLGASLEVLKRLLESASRPLLTRTNPSPHRDDAFRKNWAQGIGCGCPARSKGCDTAVPPRIRGREELFDVHEVPTLMRFTLLAVDICCWHYGRARQRACTDMSTVARFVRPSYFCLRAGFSNRGTTEHPPLNRFFSVTGLGNQVFFVSSSTWFLGETSIRDSP